MSENVNFDAKEVLKAINSIQASVKGLSELIKEMTKASKESFADIGKSMRDAFKEGGKESEGALKSIEESTKSLNKTVVDSAKSIETNWGQAFSRISVLKDSLAGFGKFFGELTQGPRQMETAMASLSFISKEVKNNYDSVRDSLLAMGRDLPIKSTTELVGSMKDLITGGYNLQDSLKLTEVAAKGAVAGFTDTSTALGALKNIMGAYSMDVSESTKVQDLLFKSVQLTGANYGELATSISGAVPGIAAMGIGFEDFLGSVTVLSEMNVPVGTSIGIMEQAAKQLTLVLGESYMQTNSLTDAMMAVYEHANGELKKITKIVREPELANAILMIGQNADSVQESLYEMGLAAGTAEKAFVSNAGTTDNMLQTIRNNLNDIKETVITSFLPAINGVVWVVKNLLQCARTQHLVHSAQFLVHNT